MVEALRGRWGDVLVDDPAPPVGYSIIVGANTDGPRAVRTMPVLRYGCYPLLRSRSVARLIVALENHVRAHVERPPVAVRTAAVICNGVAVLVPTDHAWRPGMEALLRKSGCLVVDTPWVELVSGGAIRGRAWSWATQGVLEVDAKVAGWLVSPDGAAPLPSSPAGELATAALLIDGDRTQAQEALDAVADVLRGVVPRTLGVADARSTMRAILDAAALKGASA